MRLSTCLALTTSLVFCLAGGAFAAGSQGNSDFKIGDRLPRINPGPATPDAYQEIKWDALIPQDWDPLKAFKNLNLGKLKDSDPEAMDALQKLKEAWDNAPVEPSLSGARVRIAGFMIPLERKGDRVTEFLLVPYFGACIHAPPPPANQIIHVMTAKPIKNAQTMDAVWISGTLNAGYSGSPWGSSGYKMKADLVTPYIRR